MTHRHFRVVGCYYHGDTIIADEVEVVAVEIESGIGWDTFEIGFLRIAALGINLGLECQYCSCNQTLDKPIVHWVIGTMVCICRGIHCMDFYQLLFLVD